jgi:hypothetical protein
MHNKPGLKTASKKSSLDPSNFLVVVIAGLALPLLLLSSIINPVFIGS